MPQEQIFDSMQCEQFFDATSTESVETTDEGFIRAVVKATRVGVFDYRDDKGTPIKVLRHPDDVFKEESLNTMRMIPITLNHPPKIISEDRLVNSANANMLVIGSTGENVVVNSPFVELPIILYEKEAIKEIKSKYSEISLGYTADVIDERGDYGGEYFTKRQVNIKYNHLSFVARGRAGAEVRINIDNAENDMANNLRTVIIDNNAYDVPAEVSTHVDKMYTDMQKLKDMLSTAETDREELEGELDESKKELDSTKGELDSTKEKLDEAMKFNRDESIQLAAKERISVIKDATSLISVIDNIDSMSNLDIIKHVITKKSPAVNLDGKSEEYIMGRFDSLRASIVDESTAKLQGQFKTIADNYDGSSATRTAAQAQKDMVSRLNTAYKHTK